MRRLGEIAGRLIGPRRAVWLARFGKTPDTLVWQPEPPASGDAAAGRRLAAGVLLFEGRLVEATDNDPWSIEGSDSVWTNALHGHGWLDDAVAAGDAETWDRLLTWVWTWLDRYGDGTGPGWRPELVARRLTRLIAHSVRILRGQETERSQQFFHALGFQTRYLSMSWHRTPPGLARIEALAGLVYAMLSLEGAGKPTLRAIRELGRAANSAIGSDGAIPSRNPEELARILALLAWSARSLEDAGESPSTAQIDCIKRTAPVVRALRHADGALARFHGGGTGRGLRLDAVLDEAQARGPASLKTDRAMGFLRLLAGDTTAIIDAGDFSAKPAAETAHASGLGLELTAKAQPIIVGRGSGLAFGEGSARSARRRPSASSVEIGERCPAALFKGAEAEPVARLYTTGRVAGRLDPDASGQWALCSSTEYLEAFGLEIERRVHLTEDGNRLAGEDTILATTAEGRTKAASTSGENGGLPIATRFHLHPDIRATRPLSGHAIVLTLPGGQRWRFQADADQVELEQDRYFDQTRPQPRAAIQIVASTHLIDYWGRITWSFEQIPSGAALG
ncbi:MAG: heparinase II/III family protein [Pseudomonadota bacterium]